MTKEPSYRAGRGVLRTTATQAILQQIVMLRLTLISVPFIFGFRAVGAAPMVAMLAGIAVGLLGGVHWLLPKGAVLDIGTHRGVMLAGGGMLMIACGVQTLVWLLNLSTHTSGVLLIMCMLALALALLLVEGARATLKRARQRIQNSDAIVLDDQRPSKIRT